MGNKKELVPRVQLKDVERTILTIRGQKVILDADLSKLYGVSTKRLNEQVRRNRDRFPEDFMFQLTSEEKNEVVAICDHLSNLKFSPAPIMVASVLKTPRAIEASIFVVRAFVRLREILATHKQLTRKLAELEERLGEHDEQIKVIFEAIQQLMAPTDKPRKKIGFEVSEGRVSYRKKKKQ
jgi:hypothetical protein